MATMSESSVVSRRVLAVPLPFVRGLGWGLLTAGALGWAAIPCGCSTSPPPSAQPSATSQQEKARALAAELRATILGPADVQAKEVEGLTYGARNSRQSRQVREARPMMRPLLELRAAAMEPLQSLLTDPDVYVRLTVVELLNVGQAGLTGGGGSGWAELDDRVLPELVIPLLEIGLLDPDGHVRYLAAAGLGDTADAARRSGESNRGAVRTVGRIANALPQLRNLRQDPEKKVRSIAYVATMSVEVAISKLGTSEEARQAASAEWTRSIPTAAGNANGVSWREDVVVPVLGS